MSGQNPVDVAIIGGGITGLALAIGLQRRNISFKIYERSSSFREIGAGIGFTTNAIHAMNLQSPQILEAFRSVAVQNESDYFNYVDGYNVDTKDPTYEKVIISLDVGKRGMEGCRRSDFLAKMVRLIPSDCVVFEKELVAAVEGVGKVHLSFQDGTTADADVVVGCDGIRSKLRQILFGEDHPASNPSYTHKYAIRGLVTMEKAKPILGSKPARMTHCGPQAHLVTFPVVQGTVLNMVAFVHDPGEWTAKDGRLTAPALRSEATRGFFNFGPVVRGLIDLLPDQLDKWAIFDMLDNPAPYYSSGRMCLAGDAAHAAAPHHGNGAGFGVEDGLALATLLDIVSKADVPTNSSVLKTALQVYNDVRYERCQWLVDSSRKIGNVYEFMDPEVGTNHEKFEHEMYTRSHKIWDYDMDRMVTEAPSCLLFISSQKEIGVAFDILQRQGQTLSEGTGPKEECGCNIMW